MEDYKERVKSENNELIGKIEKLIDFMHSDAYSELDSVSQGLLMLQLEAMGSYSSALARRIEIFEDYGVCDNDNDEPPDDKEQFEKIDGYRRLSQEEIDLMNEIKAAEKVFLDSISKVVDLETSCGVDLGERYRCSEIAETKINEASMWACRSVALPN